MTHRAVYVTAERAEVNVELGFNNGQHTAGQTLPLKGPGDTLGVAQADVARVWPVDATGDAEPTCFPILEFVDPDLPWRYTPSVPIEDRLAPWLCLLALRDNGPNKEIEEHLRPRAAGLPPAVRIAASTLLPDPAQAWAWAHVHVVLDGSTNSNAKQIEQATRDEPERAFARLVCPRRLTANAAWTVILVPTFERGRLAGLGQSPGTTPAVTPAWAPNAAGLNAPLELPVYHSWSFKTGEEGDFESLARRLRVRSVPPWMGFRSIDGSSPGPGLSSAGSPFFMPGALRSLTDADEYTEVDTPEKFGSDLAKRIETGQDSASPTVAPPLYGCWPAARERLEPDPATSAATGRRWVDELNADPAMRLAAGEGVRVVQQLERELMAEAWQQAGDVLRANEELRRADLARASATGIHRKRVASADDGQAVHLAGLLANRIDQSGETIEKRISAAGCPKGLLDPALRRSLRQGGVLGRARKSSEAPLAEFVSGNLEVAPAPDLQGGMVTWQTITAFLAPGSTQSPGTDPIEIDSTESRQGAGQTDILIDWLTQRYDSNDPDFQPPNRNLLDTVRRILQPLAPPSAPLSVPTNPVTLATASKQALDPTRTIPQHYKHRLSAPLEWRPDSDPLSPIIVVPTIARPMVEPLIERGLEWLLPSLAGVPENTLALMQTNRRFVEAYMVGLNHEMARELMWNGYPADPSGTVFHQFWDSAGNVAQDSVSGEWIEPDWDRMRDVKDVHVWKGDLGTHAPSGTSDQLVFLVRGLLLNRYPRTHVMAIKAKRRGQTIDFDLGNQKLPVFSGRAEPDVAFFGFDLAVSDALDDPGWFFALVEPATETRFGLDATGDPDWPSDADNLAFSHFGTAPGEWLDLRRAKQGADDAINGAWLHPMRGATPAIVAELLTVSLVRVVFHAGELFGSKEGQ